MKNRHAVTVGNIGTVHDGTAAAAAAAIYAEYVEQSKQGYGRAAAEPVTLWKNGEPIQDHTPPGNPYRRSIVSEPFTFPGCYPRYAITDDGGALCRHCCANEAERIDAATDGDGWNITATDINWEDTALSCDHCGALIESAYGEPTE